MLSALALTLAATLAGCESAPYSSPFESVYGGTVRAPGSVPGMVSRASSPRYVRAVIDDFQNHAVVQQRDQWCWAACVQMLMSQQLGRRVSQEKIVRDTIGSAADMPVTADLIERAMAATTASGGRASSMRAAFIEGPPSPAGLMEDLQAGRPRIIAVGTGDASGREHVVICYGAEFIDIGDRLVLRRIHIFDPAPNAGGFRIVEASELRGGASMSSWAGSSGGARSPHVTGTFRVVTVRG